MSMRQRALALLSVLALGCGPGADALVVEIDDGGVRLDELSPVVEARVEAEGEDLRVEILNEELERLVAEVLVLARAQTLGIQIDDEEVDAWLARLHGPDYVIDDPGYREQVRRQLTGERAAMVDLASSVQVQDDAVINYFEEHRDRYQIPPRVQIRQLVVQDEAMARRLYDEIRAGAEFAVVARAHSLAPEASDGGLLPPFARGEMPEIFDAAFDLGVDEVSEVLPSTYGYHVFLLVARYPAQVPELADVRGEILAELQTRRVVQLEKAWLRDLKRKAEIRVNERLLEGLR